jgi:hypothetical protein
MAVAECDPKMNITKFNDPLDENDFFIAESDGRKTRILPQELLTSPLFTAQDFPDERLISMENHDVLTLIESEPNLLPFKTMRLYLQANAVDRARDGTTGFSFWCHHQAGVLQLLSVPHGLHANEPPTVRIETAAGFQLRVAVKGRNMWIPQERINQYMKDQANALFTSFSWFVREAMSPANFIATVTPATQGKSVEWLRARTHYVLIHRCHPANASTVDRGAVVAESDGYLKRQAHTRRAHARVLRSPRFRKKMGQTIRVRSAWIGPNEWKQNASIYRLLPRNDA